MEWAEYFEKKDRILKQEQVGPSHEAGVAYWVSTVFLGIDHNFSMEGPPVLFETMIFANSDSDKEDPHDGYQDRYTSWEEAMAGHQTAVNLAREWIGE